MTFWDNPQMVINHIRHSCVTSDDTGMCEMVIVQDEPDIFRVKPRKRIGMQYIEEGNDFQDYSQSFDIPVSPGLMGRTPKTNTKDRLRKKPEHHCKTIHWNEQVDEMTETEKSVMFEEKDIPENMNEELQNGKISLLSQLLEDSLYEMSNPFIEYAKYDGEGLEDTCSTKVIEIFLAFLSSEQERQQVTAIRVIDTATVKDVIGLTLYKYCLEGYESKLLGQRDVRAYALYIAEDDGTVDAAFPALDEKDSISKFGFQYLAIDEKTKPKQSPKNVSVKIYLPNNGYSLVKVDRADVPMSTIFAKILKKRGFKKAEKYQLEKEGEEGHPVDLDMTLENTGSLTFTLVKPAQVVGSRRIEEKDNSVQTISAQAEIISLQYKSYQVLLVHRLLASTDVSLGIHGQKVEIDPVSQNKTQKFWTKIKPISLDFENIADCEITDDKPGGRASFRIYYKKSDDFKHYEFETTSHIANEIVKKIYNILKSRSPAARTEFLNSKKNDKTKKR